MGESEPESRRLINFLRSRGIFNDDSKEREEAIEEEEEDGDDDEIKLDSIDGDGDGDGNGDGDGDGEDDGVNNRVEEEKEDDASERGGVRWFDACWRLGLTYKEGDSVVTMGGS